MVDPINFGRTKFDPMEIRVLLLILLCIGELWSILWVTGKLRSILARSKS